MAAPGDANLRGIVETTKAALETMSDGPAKDMLQIQIKNIEARLVDEDKEKSFNEKATAPLPLHGKETTKSELVKLESLMGELGELEEALMQDTAAERIQATILGRKARREVSSGLRTIEEEEKEFERQLELLCDKHDAASMLQWKIFSWVERHRVRQSIAQTEVDAAQRLQGLFRGKDSRDEIKVQVAEAERKAKEEAREEARRIQEQMLKEEKLRNSKLALEKRKRVMKEQAEKERERRREEARRRKEIETIMKAEEDAIKEKEKEKQAVAREAEEKKILLHKRKSVMREQVGRERERKKEDARRRKASEDLVVANDAASMLQWKIISWVERHRVRQSIAQTEVDAAQRLQGLFRGKDSRDEINAVEMLATARLQAAVRGEEQRKLVSRIAFQGRNGAAMVLQAHVRSVIEREAFLRKIKKKEHDSEQIIRAALLGIKVKCEVGTR